MKQTYLNNTSVFRSLLSRSRRIFILSHVHTDGDDFGSSVALFEALSLVGLSVYLILPDGVPVHLTFLCPNSSYLKTLPQGLNSDDVVVVCGCSELSRTGQDINSLKQASIVNFDHHPDNTNFGLINFVDSSASSVAEIVHYVLEGGGWTITLNGANALACGIMCDTGNFKFSNTCQSALVAMSKLVGLGVSPTFLSMQMARAKGEEALRAWTISLNLAQMNSVFKCVSVAVTDDSLSPESFDGVTDFLNRAKGSSFTLLLRQDGAKIRGSLRSTPFQHTDVSKLAVALGGGGHVYASGFSIPGILVLKDGKYEIQN